MRWRLGLAVGPLLAVLAWLLLQRRLIRFVVQGVSMHPTLDDGDFLSAWKLRSGRQAKAGTLVIVRDPRDLQREMVKRAIAATADGSLVVLGDNPESSTDSRQFGPVPPELIVGRVMARYWPLGRMRVFL